MSSKSMLLAGLVAGALVMMAAEPPCALAEDASNWLADAKTGCKIWDGVPEAGESVSWDGPCQDGLASGPGTLLWFKDGKANGSYVGERVAGKAPIQILSAKSLLIASAERMILFRRSM